MSKPRPRGRPPLGDEAMRHVTARLLLWMVRTIDEMARKRRDGADRSQIVRELLKLAIVIQGAEDFRKS